MHYDAIIIGAGLSGLTAASLLAKRGLKVLVIEKQFKPGGSCGIFKRNDVTFDQGSAMLYGFGDTGFNPHRFVFNCLEEPIDMIKHDILYTVVYEGHRIRFFCDIEQFIAELSGVFPGQAANITRFYHDMYQLYNYLFVEEPVYATPDETPPSAALRQFSMYPATYVRFLSYMFKSAKDLLAKYFDDPAIFRFFDKLTSTYCYTSVAETPAVMAAVMFIDNHVGGSFYPAGSTLHLPGKLEKVIEENDGDMLYEQEVSRILIEKGRANGVVLADGRQFATDAVIYSGTVWNLYERLIPEKDSSAKKRAWAKAMEPTLPSVVLYATVDESVIPAGTSPVEMLVGNPSELDENEVTVYIFSIDDHSTCPPGCHAVMAIGPSLQKWPAPVGDYHTEDYKRQKEVEQQRLISVLERRFPGFGAAVRHIELSTPTTIERYTMKNGGCVAGPKQRMGQHMLNRLHIRTEWRNLYCCGESTVMGTGTPAVTVSGISAANAALRKKGLKPFEYDPRQKNYVRILKHPVQPDDLFRDHSPYERELIQLAGKCQFCEDAPCMAGCPMDIRGIMRRTVAGNFIGARKAVVAGKAQVNDAALVAAEQRCVRLALDGKPVPIRIISEMIETLYLHRAEPFK